MGDAGRQLGRVACAAPVAWAAAVMAHLALVRPTWRDEEATRDYVDASWSGFMSMVGHQDAVAAPYYLLLRLPPGGMTVWRLLSVAAMTGALALAVAVARREGGPLAGVVCGLVACANGALLDTGSQARGYAIATFGVAWLVWLAGRRGSTAAPVVAVFGHLFAVFPVVMWLAARKTRSPAVWAAALGPAAVLFAAGWSQRGQVSWIGDTGPHLIGALAVVCGTVWVLVAVLLGCFLARRGDWPWLAWWAGPWLLLATVSFVYPVLAPRYVVESAPASGLLLGVFTARALALVVRSRPGVVVRA